MKRILPVVALLALIATTLLLLSSGMGPDPAQALTEPETIPSYEIISVEPLEDGRIIFRVGEK